MRTAERPRLSLREYGPQRVFSSLWIYRKLIYQLAKREVALRYRGSFLGLAWSFATPILMLAVYTFVFSVVFKARWDVGTGNRTEFALILFAGLFVFQLFSDCIARAPSLMLENVSYIKRIVFPLEALTWVALASAFFNALISVAVLLFAEVLIIGIPPVTALWLPVVLLPLCFLIAGGVWFLSAAGVYIRDLRQAVGVLIPILMFASPIFYPISAIPERIRSLIYLNPLAFIIEQARDVLLFGHAPNLVGLGLYGVLSVTVAWFGLTWFLIVKRGFADVV